MNSPGKKSLKQYQMIEVCEYMKVYLSEYIHPEAVAKLRERAQIVNDFDDPESIDAAIIRVAEINRTMMERAKNLKVIGKHGIGYNTIDVNAAKELGIRVVYTPRANVNSVAELIVALVLNVSRNISLVHGKVKKSQIKTIAPEESKGVEISGKTLGLIGMGNIARLAAGMLKNGFGMKLIGYDPFVTAGKAEGFGIRKIDTLEELVSEADIVSISIPFTKETENLVDKRLFEHFKPNSILINTARGGIVNEQDLYHALTQGKLRGAACDVFVKEPPDENNLLVGLDNFVATPHIGANTEEALYNMGMTVVDEVFRVLDGKEPNFPVV